jgi:hypothetical protein
MWAYKVPKERNLVYSDNTAFRLCDVKCELKRAIGLFSTEVERNRWVSDVEWRGKVCGNKENEHRPTKYCFMNLICFITTTEQICNTKKKHSAQLLLRGCMMCVDNLFLLSFGCNHYAVSNTLTETFSWKSIWTPYNWVSPNVGTL